MRKECPSEDTCGVMGHIAKSDNPPSKTSYNFDAEVRNGSKRAAAPEQVDSDAQQQENLASNNPLHVSKGGFMEKYRRRFGPSLELVGGGATLYGIDREGWLVLNGHRLRRTRFSR